MLTDEQWVWLFVNQCIDTDEKLEGMCNSCRDEATSNIKKCSKCGKPIEGSGESFVNPNFDESKYNTLKNGADIETQEDICDDDIDIDLLNQLLDEE